MLSFECDYNNGCHPKILERLMETNEVPCPGYGEDEFTASAGEKIKKACNCPNGDVFFISGGTQTNVTVIASMLRPFEGVITAATGHINAHEAGALEYTGFKALPIKNHMGKIDAKELNDYIETFYNDANREHMVFPGMVYISHPTEYGSIYQKSELEAISKVCKKRDIPLFIDGARLGYGLFGRGADLSLEDIAGLCDVFYIGGTKVGALCGEAVVFPNKRTPKHFVHMIKKHGALLAKGRLLGVQFDTLFTDDLYLKISKNAMEKAAKLIDICKEKGLQFFYESPTNQQFVILENEQMKNLSQKVRFGFWERFDDNHTVVRFAVSWATKDEDLEALRSIL